MYKYIYVCALLFAVYISIGALGQKVNAAFVYFEPTTFTAKPGEEFTVTIGIDTEVAADAPLDQRPSGADVVVVYDKEIVELVEVVEQPENDKFFPKIIVKSRNNTLYIGAFNQSPNTKKGGTGIIGKAIFKAKSNGSSDIEIVCSAGSTRDTNVMTQVNKVPADIVDCQKIRSAAVVVSDSNAQPTPKPTTGSQTSPTTRPTTTTGSTVTPSTTPTGTVSPSPSPTATKTPTPTPLVSQKQVTATPEPTLVKSGTAEMTKIALGFGVILVIASIIIKSIIL